MNLARRTFLPLLASLLGQAGAQAPLAPEPTAPGFDLRPFQGLFIDTPDAAGAIWARGATYKLGVGADGVTYVPLFGSRAPRNFPLHLRLAAVGAGAASPTLVIAAPPRRDGARISIDHGPVVERWELTPTTAEQSFVLGAPLGTGDLTFRLAVTTELAPVVDDTGLVFVAPGLGTVHYSHAVLVDARGRRTALPVSFAAGEIVVRVPDAVLTSASYPIVVDPVLTRQAFDTSAADSTHPDVSYDVGNDVWLVVNQELVSGGDGDIRCRRYRGDGTLIDDGYVQSSTISASDPAVANNKLFAKFLVAWVEDRGLLIHDVFVREREAASATQGNPLLLDTALQGIGTVDVGGATGSSRFLVAWTVAQGATPLYFSDVFAQAYVVGGVLGPRQTLSRRAGCAAAVSVSKSAGPGQRWAVVWENTTAILCVGGDVVFSILDTAGGIRGGGIAEVAVALTNHSPDVAGDGTNFFVVWHRGLLDNDLYGAQIGPVGGGFQKIGSTFALTQLEPGSLPSEDQVSARIEFDGCRYLYTYFEGATRVPFAATMLPVGGVLRFMEGHVRCSNSTVPHSLVAIASQGSAGGEPGQCQLVWQQIGTGGLRDVHGARFDVRATAGGFSTIGTHCPSRSATTIDTSGTPALGRTFTVSLGNVTGVPLIFVGGTVATPLPLCTAPLSTCRLGVRLPAALTLSASSVTLRVPCDINLIGGDVAFQGVDVTAGGGCAASLFGVAFRTTDTVVARLQ